MEQNVIGLCIEIKKEAFRATFETDRVELENEKTKNGL